MVFDYLLQCFELQGDTGVMKRIILIFVFCLQTIFASAAFAWSPLEQIESAVDRIQNCYLPSVVSEQGEQGESSEEEEEPDCE